MQSLCLVIFILNILQIMDVELKKWCDTQTRMIDALQSNLTLLIRDNVPQLEKYHQQVASINMNISRDAIIISQMKLLIDTYGAANFVRIVEHAIQCRTCEQKPVTCVSCKLIAKHSLTKDNLVSFLHLLKAHQKELKTINQN